MKTLFPSFPQAIPAMTIRSSTLLVLLAQPALLIAEIAVPAPPLELVSGLPGKQVRLNWPAETGLRYRVEKSTALASGGTGGWTQVALVEAPGAAGVWLDAEPTGEKAFYRVAQPAAEVFAITPPLLAPAGGELLIHGQRLPAGSLLVLESDGQAPLAVALESLGGGVWRAAVVGGQLPGGAILSARVVDAGGTTLVTLNQTISVTASGRALDSPPALPPAAPVPQDASKPVPRIGIVVKHGNGPAARVAPGGDQDCDGEADESDAPVASLIAAFLSKKGYDYYQAQSSLSSAGLQTNPLFVDHGLAGANPLNDASRLAHHKHPDLMRREMGPGGISPAPSGLPGEVSFQTCALALETPAGPPLAWVQTYRSIGGGGGSASAPWDACYNISVEALPSSAGSNAPRVVIRDGGGRTDIFNRQADGSYRCGGMFREGRFDANNTFTLTFADKGTWTFRPLDSPLAAGKIAAITDRNGVALACDYNQAGHLATVSSQFGQSLTLSYDSSGQVARITDHTGRFVDCVYYEQAEQGGNSGDLKSISCPQLAKSPPVAGPTVFTYTTGSSDPHLNGNLLTLTDGAGRLLESFTYSGQTDPLQIDYDTCDSHNRNKTGHVTLNRRELKPAGSSPAGGYTVFEVDEIGRLTETDCDRLHRVVARRQFTGFCVPNVAVTSTTNRPTGKLRASDPDCFETTCAYNADSLCTRITHPDGSQELVTYDRDFRPDCPVREGANPRMITLRGSDGQERTVACDYVPGFGNPESARPGNPIKGITVKGGRNPGGDATAQSRKGWDGSVKGRKGWDGSVKGRKGWDGSIKGRKGWDGSIKGGLAKEEGGRHTPFHNKPRALAVAAGIAGGAIAARVSGVDDDCDGRDDDCDGFVVNAHTSPFDLVSLTGEDEDCDGDCNDLADAKVTVPKQTQGTTFGERMLGSDFRTRLVSAHGQVSSRGYDAAGNCTSASSPLPGKGQLYQYDAQGRCTSCTVLNGADASFHDTCTYDAASGFLSSVVCDSSGLQLATIIGRDALGRVTSVTDPRGNNWLYAHNPLDQCVQVQSPAMPNRISMNLTIDAGGRAARCDLENRAPDGALDTSNPAYSTFHVYDDRGRLVRVAEEERPVDASGVLTPDSLDLANFAIRDLTYDDAGQCVRVSTPAACRAQATDLACDFSYDERGLLHRCIEGGAGNAAAVTSECDYDALGACVRCATLAAAGAISPEALFTYDSFHRLSAARDPMGNVATFAYDNRGSVTESCYGEVNDVPGSAGNVLLARQKTSSDDFAQVRGFKVELSASDRLLPRLHVGAVPCARSAFFGVEVEDDTCTVERFSPGDTGNPATEVTVVDRSPAGLVQTVTRNGDLLQSFAYDSAGRRIRCADGSCITAATLDACGNVTALTRTDISGVLGVPSKTFTTSCVLDPLGRVTQSTAGNDNVSTASYDSLDRCVSLTAPGRPPLQFTYDGGTVAAPFSVQIACDIASSGSPQLLASGLVRSGECRSTTDSYGHSTVFSCDALGRASRCDHPDGTYATTSFDALGRPAVQRRKDGALVSGDFDLNGRPTLVTRSNVPPAVAASPLSLAYDGLGRTIRCEQGAFVSVMTYDSCGNPLSEDQNGRIVARTFNHRGRTGITYPDHRHFDESRNPLGQLLAITTANGNSVATMEYAGHRVARKTQGNGVVTHTSYRADGESGPAGAEDFSFDACVRATVSHSSFSVLADQFIFRDRSQQTTRCETRFSAAADAACRTQAFARDGLGRVTACLTQRRETAGGQLAPESAVSYTLDPAGRRLGEIRNSDSGTYTQSNLLPPGDQQMGQYTSWPGSTLPLEWDDNGNLRLMTNGSARLDCVYNDAGQLVAVNDASGSPAVPLLTYAYDALGRCALRTLLSGTTSVTTAFVYDGTDCIQELGDDGTGTGTMDAAMTFVASGGLKLCISTRDGSLYYPHAGAAAPYGNDGGGDSAYRNGPRICTCPTGFKTVNLVTSATGAVVERFDCDDAGKPLFLTSDGLPNAASASAIGLRWLAPDCAWDPELGMFHCPGGVYSPQLGTVVSAAKRKEYVGHVTLMK